MRLAVRLAAALATLLAAGAARSETVTLSLAEAHALAQQAYMAGDAALAQAIARRLLEANPGDARALLLIAATAPVLGQPREGRVAGQAAWRAARGAPQLRYEIARFTARAALAEGRPGLAQFWLRRASDVAPDEGAGARTARDHAGIKATRRFSYSIDVSATPSSNVNGGATGDALTVNDNIYVGTLSGDAQALSGVRGAAQVRLTWSLPAAERHRVVLGVRGYATAISLSDAAERQAPGAQGSDYAISVIEGTATADWAPGTMKNSLRFEVGVGNTWYGGADLGSHLRGEIGVPLHASRQSALTVSVEGERQTRDAGLVDSVGLRLEGGRLFARGGRANASLALRDVRGDDSNSTYRLASAEVGFAFGRAVGPAELTLGAQVAWRDYPFYRLGFIGVTDGREDFSAGVSVRAAFPGWSRLGYMPELRLSLDETNSNISRFDTRTLGVGIGIRSRF